MTTAKKAPAKRAPAKKAKTVAGWTITWRGQSWTDDDLTGLHLATLALISGDDRFEDLTITPEEVALYPALGFMRAFNLLRTFVLVAALDGTDGDEANEIDGRVLDELKAATADELIGAFAFRFT